MVEPVPQVQFSSCFYRPETGALQGFPAPPLQRRDRAVPSEGCDGAPTIRRPGGDGGVSLPTIFGGRVCHFQFFLSCQTKDALCPSSCAAHLPSLPRFTFPAIFVWFGVYLPSPYSLHS